MLDLNSPIVKQLKSLARRKKTFDLISADPPWYYNDKANVYITRKEAMDGMPEYYVNGIRVLEEQAITDEEAVIKEAK